jgi:DNA gyrase/topoisomerase IV subunit A
MDEDKVREMAAKVEQLIAVHKEQHELMKKLLTIVVKHLNDRRRIVPTETWRERQDLIAALEQLATEDEHGRGH